MQLQELANLVSNQASDLDVYANFLFTALDGALPPTHLQIKRHSSMGDRLRGRPPRVVEAAVRLGENAFVLRRPDSAGVLESLICHEVGGVVLSRQSVPLGQWSTALAAGLQQLAEDNAAAASTLARLTRFDV